MYKVFSVSIKHPISCILIAILLCFIQQNECQLTKCCPNGFVLETEDYSCLENDTIWDSYNIGPPSIPDCERRFQSVFENKEAYSSLNGCFDKNTNDQYVAVSCVQNPGTIVDVGVHLINKCCPVGQSYDHSERSCVQNSESHAHFKNIFGNSAVIFENNLPNCSIDEVFVEYSSTVHSIRFSEKNMKVNGNHLLADKFCIEDLVNVDANEAGENEQHIIVRSCRPSSVCDEMTCIRRCCSVDQIMLSKPKRCGPHPNKTNLVPIFYDITFPLSNSQAKTRLKGMNTDNPNVLYFIFYTNLEIKNIR